MRDFFFKLVPLRQRRRETHKSGPLAPRSPDDSSRPAADVNQTSCLGDGDACQAAACSSTPFVSLPLWCFGINSKSIPNKGRGEATGKEKEASISGGGRCGGRDAPPDTTIFSFCFKRLKLSDEWVSFHGSVSDLLHLWSFLVRNIGHDMLHPIFTALIQLLLWI